MINRLLYLLPLLILMGCGNQSSESNVASSSIDEEGGNDATVPEAAVSIDRSLLSKIADEYYIVTTDNDQVYFQEPCEYLPYHVNITETAEDSGEWNIYYNGDTYDIAQVEEAEGDIRIVTRAESAGMESTFLFSPNENESLWDFIEVGMQGISTLAKTYEMENIEIRPCSDMSKIMAYMEDSWYLISKIDGKDVLYEPCEEAPGGFSLEGSNYDNWSGSDPYAIVSMTKKNNIITMKYKSLYNDEIQTQIIHNLAGEVIQLGDGSPDDSHYIREESKDIYTTIEEGCS